MCSHRLLQNTWKACATHSPDNSQLFCAPTRRRSYEDHRSCTCSLLAHKLEAPLPRTNRWLSVRRIELVRLLSIDRTLCCVDVSFPPHRFYPARWAFQLSAPHSRCFSRIKNTEAELIQSDVYCTYDNNRTICNLLCIWNSYVFFFWSYIHCNQRNQRKHRKQQSAGRKKSSTKSMRQKHTQMDRRDTMDVSNWSKKWSFFSAQFLLIMMPPDRINGCRYMLTCYPWHFCSFFNPQCL